MNDHPIKFILSVTCGWIAGLTTLIHIGPWPMFGQHLNDAIVFLFGCVKAGIVGGCSWMGATWVSSLKRKHAAWRANRKSKK